jgi:GT2 family glycosyltransferase
MNISVLVGLKNNLEYSQKFYKRFREIYSNIELCFVSYGSTDNTHNWLDSLSDPNLKYFYSDESKTFSDTFNKCAELATQEYIVFCHNDIVVLKGWLENIIKHLTPTTAVTYTTIEPPIFAGHERPGKLIRDFGLDFDQVNYSELEKLNLEIQNKDRDKVTNGAAFFIAQHRETYLKIGGMDNLFSPMFCEDDDLLYRLELLGTKLIVSLDSLVYHFVSKTSRFSDEYKTTTKLIEYNSNRNYIRKWGSKEKTSKYHIGYIIKNCTDQLLSVLEPWGSSIYVDCDYKNYINQEQSNTKFDLWERIKPYDNKKNCEILVEIDGNIFTQQDFNYIIQLNEIIKDSGEIGEFELGNLKITINSLQEYQNDLIHIYKHGS